MVLFFPCKSSSSDYTLGRKQRLLYFIALKSLLMDISGFCSRLLTGPLLPIFLLPSNLPGAGLKLALYVTGRSCMRSSKVHPYSAPAINRLQRKNSGWNLEPVFSGLEDLIKTKIR